MADIPKDEVNEILPGMAEDEQIPEGLDALDLSGEGVITSEDTETDVPKVDEAQVKEESEASEHGWQNKEEWVASGKDAAKWRPASEFNDFRRQAAPLLAKENQELRRRLENIERNQRIKDEAEREARENLARESLNLELKQAREDNDWDRAFEVQNKLFDLRFKNSETPKAQPQANPQAEAALNAFMAANPVIKTDTMLQRKIQQQVKLIIDANGPGDPVEVLDEAWDNVKRLYPEKFRRSTTPAMADTGGSQGRPTNGRSWNNLKPNVRAEYDQFIRDNPAVKRESLLPKFPAEWFRS